MDEAKKHSDLQDQEEERRKQDAAVRKKKREDEEQDLRNRNARIRQMIDDSETAAGQRGSSGRIYGDSEVLEAINAELPGDGFLEFCRTLKTKSGTSMYDILMDIIKKYREHEIANGQRLQHLQEIADAADKEKNSRAVKDSKGRPLPNAVNSSVMSVKDNEFSI